MQPSDAELTRIYNAANGIEDGKRPPISSERIFRAMRTAMAVEREANAAICEELEQHWSDYKDTAMLNGNIALSNAASGEPRAARAIAAAIRARGNGDKE